MDNFQRPCSPLNTISLRLDRTGCFDFTPSPLNADFLRRRTERSETHFTVQDTEQSIDSFSSLENGGSGSGLLDLGELSAEHTRESWSDSCICFNQNTDYRRPGAVVISKLCSFRIFGEFTAGFIYRKLHSCYRQMEQEHLRLLRRAFLLR